VVYISIGNSDDKLSQAEWARYYSAVALAVRRAAEAPVGAVHGQWVSEPASAWQNACWALQLPADTTAIRNLRAELASLAGAFNQDSISWAVAPTPNSSRRRHDVADGALPELARQAPVLPPRPPHRHVVDPLPADRPRPRQALLVHPLREVLDMTTTTTQAAPTIRERVQSGAAWLDQHHPGWPDRIDLERLEMEHCHRCILGQVIGDYYQAPLELDTAIAYGFDASGSEQPNGSDAWFAQLNADFAALATEWTRTIRVRRGEVACCPCVGLICDPGCECTECPHDESELTDE
jgi:hypothetical protein